MQAVVLAADGPSPNGHGIPRCMRPWIDGKPVLSLLLSALNYVGLESHRVTVVTGRRQTWNKIPESQLSFLEPYNQVINEAASETASGLSLFNALQAMSIHGPVVVVNGDLIPNLQNLQAATEHLGNDVVFGRAPYWMGEKGLALSYDFDDSTLVSVSAEAPSQWPWALYAGFMCVATETAQAISAIEDKSISDKSAVDLVVEYGSAASLSQIAGASSGSVDLPSEKELVGGSFANLSTRLLVRKAAKGRGSAKLLREIDWLSNVDKKVLAHVPRVVDSRITGDEVWFEMPFYSQPSLRKQILLDFAPPERFGRFLEVVLTFLGEHVYKPTAKEIQPEQGLQWLLDSHYGRFFERWSQLYDLAPTLRPILSANSVKVNGKNYPSMDSMVAELFGDSARLKRLAPNSLSSVHGDLHFQNILVDLGRDLNAFVLADPRGETAFDHHYDLGKLWHSFHGLYDLIHLDRYRFQEYSSNGAHAELSYEIGDANLRSIYSRIGIQVDEAVNRNPLLSSDSEWKTKTLFNEAMHFATLPIFHLRGDGKEHRPLVMMGVAIELLYSLLEDS